jgi:hypothetical protein
MNYFSKTNVLFKIFANFLALGPTRGKWSQSMAGHGAQ